MDCDKKMFALRSSDAKEQFEQISWTDFIDKEKAKNLHLVAYKTALNLQDLKNGCYPYYKSI